MICLPALVVDGGTMNTKMAMFIMAFWLFIVPVQAQQLPSSEQRALTALTHQGFNVKQIKSSYQEGSAVLVVQATRQGKRYELILALPSLRVMEQKIKR